MEKKVNLEGIFYNKDGDFTPLTDNHGNTEESLAHLRNTYMEAERDYFEHLLAIKEIRNEFSKYLEFDSETLIQIATKIQQDLEFGNLETPEELETMQSMSLEEREIYHMEKLEQAEAMMCLLYAAVRDKAKILELVKTFTSARDKEEYIEEPYTYNTGRSR